MKYFDWSIEKNEQLKIERRVHFNDIVIAVSENRVLDYYPHPNPKKYPNQNVYVININDYAYLVPCIEDGDKIFLKTIIPSRKATKYYIINSKENI